MQLLVSFFVALVALGSAQQLKNGPQLLYEEPSSSESSQKTLKRSVTQKFNLYFTPETVQGLQAEKSSQNSASTLKQNSGISKEFYNELVQKYYAENLKPPPIDEPQVELARSLPNFFLPREESVDNNKPNYRQLFLDQTKLSGHAQNVPKNKFNQFASPSGTDLASAFFDLASGVNNRNKNEDQRTSEKQIEYFLRNVQIDQPRQLNSPTEVRVQNIGKNVGRKKSAIEKEIENAWKQHQAFSARDEKNTEGRKQIKIILKNGQYYGFERFNATAEVNNRDSQAKNMLHNEAEVKREIEKLWRNQQDYQFLKSFFPVEVFNQGFKNENKDNTKVDQQIENILIPQPFVYESSNSPAEVSKPSLSATKEKQEITKEISRPQAFGYDFFSQRPLSRNENQDTLKEEKQISFILRNLKAENERVNSPDVSNESHFVTNTDQNKSYREKEIQNILNNHLDFEFQRSKFGAVASRHGYPIKIERVPVPILKTVQVSVPTTVPVPTPHTYEVRVPYLYPVPLKVVKHVPVPLLKNY